MAIFYLLVSESSTQYNFEMLDVFCSVIVLSFRNYFTSIFLNPGNKSWMRYATHSPPRTR